uniref:G_PROTEIN_RECEP_F3_4 domain-containing protein n=1 Tax=Angiostrongylus cantonensis TaxID=6313 RepID=A0A0K0DGN3_ANGCA
MTQLSSGVLFIFVKHSDEKSMKDAIDMERSEGANSDVACGSNSSVEANWRQQLRRKLIYIFMAMLLATFNGLMVAPIEILKQRYPPRDSYQVLDYTWSFFSMVFVVSTIFFLLYCIIRRRNAYVNKEMIIPAAGYGMLWSAGMVFWLVSSDVLLQVIVYPIVTRVAYRILSKKENSITESLVEKKDLAGVGKGGNGGNGLKYRSVTRDNSEAMAEGQILIDCNHIW